VPCVAWGRNPRSYKISFRSKEEPSINIVHDLIETRLNAEKKLKFNVGIYEDWLDIRGEGFMSDYLCMNCLLCCLPLGCFVAKDKVSRKLHGPLYTMEIWIVTP
jgi:hypothetical protein